MYSWHVVKRVRAGAAKPNFEKGSIMSENLLPFRSNSDLLSPDGHSAEANPTSIPDNETLATGPWTEQSFGARLRRPVSVRTSGISAPMLVGLVLVSLVARYSGEPLAFAVCWLHMARVLQLIDVPSAEAA